jgi:hypothetical protein
MHALLLVLGASRPAPKGELVPQGLRCTPRISRLIFTLNDAYSHVLANQVAHLHNLDCRPPALILCQGNASMSLCELLMGEGRNAIQCELVDAPSKLRDEHDQRKAIAFLKFVFLRRELAKVEDGGSVLYLDGTAMVQGAHCLDELDSLHADVLVSAERTSPEMMCPDPALAPELDVSGANANTGVIFFRATPHGRAWLDHLVAEYEEYGPPDYKRRNPFYENCLEQAWFNLKIQEHENVTHVEGTRTWELPLPNMPGHARVQLLEYSRWPRFLVPDVRAYASWPAAVRARVGNVLAEGLARGPGERESMTFADRHTGQPLEACLYHPVVRKAADDHSHTSDRGNQAIYFQKDGMWYL